MTSRVYSSHFVFYGKNILRLDAHIIKYDHVLIENQPKKYEIVTIYLILSNAEIDLSGI